MNQFSKYAKTFASDASHSVLMDFFLNRLLPFVFPFIAGFFMTGLAYFTNSLKDYAPFSYGLAFLIGFVLYSVGWWIWGSYRISVAKSRILELSSTPKSSINPLENHFRNQRIYLSDFFLPYDHRVANKTFVDCELLGPATIILTNGIYEGLTFFECDFIKLKSADKVLVQVGLHLDNVTMKNCKLYKFSIIMMPDMAEAVKNRFPSANWISD